MKQQNMPQAKSVRMRQTVHRKTILSIFDKAHAPLAVDEIHQRMPKADLVTIYRNVERLTSMGIIRIVRFRDDKVRYEMSRDGHHHHVVCESCGHIDELPECRMRHEESVAREAPSFMKVTDHALEYFGVCKKCA